MKQEPTFVGIDVARVRVNDTGGRVPVRTIRCVGAPVARRRNPVVREIQQRMPAAGRFRNSALAACVREPLIILNGMVKIGRRRKPAIVAS